MKNTMQNLRNNYIIKKLIRIISVFLIVYGAYKLSIDLSDHFLLGEEGLNVKRDEVDFPSNSPLSEGKSEFEGSEGKGEGSEAEVRGDLPPDPPDPPGDPSRGKMGKWWKPPFKVGNACKGPSFKGNKWRKGRVTINRKSQPQGRVRWRKGRVKSHERIVQVGKFT